MNDINAIVARPRPGVKRIKIADPVADLAAEIERILLDTSRNKDARIQDGLLKCRNARKSKHN